MTDGPFNFNSTPTLRAQCCRLFFAKPRTDAREGVTLNDHYPHQTMATITRDLRWKKDSRGQQRLDVGALESRRSRSF